MGKVIAGTSAGTRIFECTDHGWRMGERALEGSTVNGITSQGSTVLAGTTEGIRRSDDGGATWQAANSGLNILHVRQIAFHPQEAGVALAGTEPAAIFVTRDGGESWRECPEVSDLRRIHGWFLPYSPGAGCIRSFGFHGNRVYAAAEVGGLLRSDDCGESWRLVEGSNGVPDFNAPVLRTHIHPDVHDVVTHPASPDLVYAATMQGLYRSLDGGKKWLHLYADCYVRAVWLDPADFNHLLLGPGDDVSINGQVEQSHSAGYSWEIAAGGLATPWRRAVVERFVPVGSDIFAVVSDGRLFVTHTAEIGWQPVTCDAPVLAVAPLA